MNLQDFLSFRRMITPVIIKILFWIGLGASALLGLSVFFSGIVSGIDDGSFLSVLSGLIGGPLIFALGVLSSRIYCELLIVVFQINETLTDIKNLKERE